MNKRLINLKEYIKSASLDSIVITDRKNMRYFSGYTGEGYMVVTEHDSFIVTDFRYTEQAEKQTEGFGVYDSADFSAEEAFKNFEATGFEDRSISFSRHEALKKVFANLVPVGIRLLDMRAVKDEEEIENIRIAEHIGDMAFSHILGFIKPGVSERDVALEIEFFMRKNGAEALSFDTIVATGAHGAMPHAEPDHRLISAGDFVVLDFGCVYNGYSSDMTRTVCVGKASEAMKDVYNTVLSAQLSSLDMLKAGVKACDVHNNAQSIIDINYKGRFGHSLGHGVGLDIHESPTLSSRNTEPLAVNNVVTVEPGIYIPDFCGVRIEDLVVIKEDGVLNLTQSPKNLIEL